MPVPPALAAWVPRTARTGARERLRSALGALFGIAATGLAARAAVGTGTALPALIAPMGASAVLLFAVPASPLAQPWSMVGGNLTAALVGVTAARLVPDPALAAAVAVAVAIGAMMTLRCVHPPSGAVALTAVLGGRAVTDLGYGFVLWPVLADSAVLLACALLFNNAAGRPYPHRAAPAAPGPGSAPRLGFSAEDLDAALSEYGQLLDVDRDDLAAVLRGAELHAWGRRAGRARCAAAMRRDAVAIAPGARLAEAMHLMRARGADALPVTDEGARVLGLLTRSDLIARAAWGAEGPRLGLGRRLRLTFARGRAPLGCVADVMTAPVPSVAPDTPLGDAAHLMAAAQLGHLPVVGEGGRLAGLLSQGDLVSALLAEAGRAPEA